MLETNVKFKLISRSQKTNEVKLIAFRFLSMLWYIITQTKHNKKRLKSIKSRNGTICFNHSFIGNLKKERKKILRRRIIAKVNTC